MARGKIIFHKPSEISPGEYTDVSDVSLIEGVPEWREYWTFTHSNCGLDLKFLEDLHGFSTRGHLPLDRMGKVKNKQGVELATNIDLSEWTAVELRNLGLNEGIVRKVEPFCQKRGEFAFKTLSQRSLQLRKEETLQLREACLKKLVSQISQSYDESVQGRTLLKSWDELTQAQRTVIYDVLTQCQIKSINRGPNDCPMFWNQATEQQWPNTVSCLRKLSIPPDSARSRPASRREDVKLLEADILGKHLRRPKSSISSCTSPKYSNSRANSRLSSNAGTSRRVYSYMTPISAPSPRSVGRPNSGRFVDRRVNPDTVVKRPRKEKRLPVGPKSPCSTASEKRSASRNTALSAKSSLSTVSLEESSIYQSNEC